MALPAPPDDPGWQRNGYQFDNIPNSVQSYVRHQIEIPQLYLSQLFPDSRLSVTDFVYGGHLPPIHKGAYPVPHQHSFFSTEPPIEDMSKLRSIQVPPKGVVARIMDQSKQAWLDGKTSISLPRESIFIPLWAPKFWTRLYYEYQPSHDRWKEALEWLKREDLDPFRDQTRQTLESLGRLTWEGHIRSDRSQFASAEGKTAFLISELQGFLSRSWLSDSQIDLMIYHLEWEIRKTQPSADIHFIDIPLGNKIKQLYDIHADGKIPYQWSGTHFWQVFGSKLTSTSQIGGIFHVNGNHWIAIVVDAGSEELLYGDPAGGHPDANEWSNVLRWFLSKHVPALEEDTLENVTLPAPKQNLRRDWWSCGIFSHNALAHRFAREPLLSQTENHVFPDLARMAMLQRIIAYHISQSSDNEQVLPSNFDINAGFFSNDPPARVSTSRPTTPSNVVTHEVTQALQQLSVSPKKPKKKKKKITGISVIAPKFEVDRVNASVSARKAEDDRRKAEAKHNKRKRSEMEDSDAELSVSDSKKGIGRPRLDILENLTVDTHRRIRGIRQYKCAGVGCQKIFNPRTRSRVINHCKSCLKMTSEQRRMAATAGSDTAPGALVANTITQLTTAPDVAAASKTLSTNSLIPKLPPEATDKYAFFGKGGRRAHHQALDLAVVKFICVARLAPNIVELNVWKDLFRLQTPSYKPASRSTLSESHIQSEQEHVKKLQYEYLKTQTRISISFDGGTVKSGASLYTLNATTEGDKVILLEGQDCTGISHTGEMIADFIERVLTPIGLERFIAVSSDNTGNTRVAREILVGRMPWILNFPDPDHHINNTWKEIASLSYFGENVKQVRAVIKYFKQSGHAKNLLRQLRQQGALGPGLESIGKTRFATLLWSAESVKRCLPAIRTLASEDKIEIPKWHHIFDNSNKSSALQFEMILTQFVSVGGPLARAIECLEATAANPADVYLYWLAIVAGVKEALATCFLPDEVCGQIRGIINKRWREFFIDGPTNAHLTAFYLNPSYVRSSIFKQPNPLSFNIVVPAKEPSNVPPGVQNPRTFLNVAEYLFDMLTREVEHGLDPSLTAYKKKKKLFAAKFQQQFTAYAQKAYPFNAPLGLNQTPLDWWKVLLGTENAGIVAAGAVKLYTAVPHSMADERTMSVITMLNTAQRNRQSVGTLVAHAQIRGYYMEEEKRKVRKSARPNPVVRFFDIERVLRCIDDDKEEARGVNYDESDDEEDVVLVGKGEDPSAPQPSISASRSLPLDDDEDIDTASDELAEILADGPLTRKPKAAPSFSDQPKREDDEDDSDDEPDGEYGLGAWI